MSNNPYKRKGLYKPQGSEKFVIRITRGGRRIFETTGTGDEKLAAEFYDRFMADLWEQDRLGVAPDHTWEEAVLLYMREKQLEGIRGIEERIMRLKWLDGFLSGKMLREIDSALLEQIADAKRLEPKRGVRKKDKPVTEDTVAKYIKLIKAILNTAVHKGWLTNVPRIKVRESRARIRWITREQAARLVAVCPMPYRPIIQFALMTGLRSDNIRTLKWEQIDMPNRRIYFNPEQMKTGKPFVCYLNREAIDAIRQCMGRHTEYVFVNQHGELYGNLNNGTWSRAVEKAGLTDFRFHDLRHTWATWHLQSGTSLYELQRLGGWSNLSMVQRYAHLAEDQLGRAADGLAATKTPQSNVVNLQGAE